MAAGWRKYLDSIDAIENSEFLSVDNLNGMSNGFVSSFKSLKDNLGGISGIGSQNPQRILALLLLVRNESRYDLVEGIVIIVGIHDGSENLV